jgi:hypothetical protein
MSFDEGDSSHSRAVDWSLTREKVCSKKPSSCLTPKRYLLRSLVLNLQRIFLETHSLPLRANFDKNLASLSAKPVAVII